MAAEKSMSFIQGTPFPVSPKPPVLSICIPTYNRPECIGRSLQNYESVLSQPGVLGKVELCISDNSPEADTRAVVEKFISRGKLRIKYNKNQGNLGYDRNAMLAYGLASGDYLHSVSDEDIYSAEAIRAIVSRLESQRPGAIAVVSYNIPFMPALEALPDMIESPDSLFRLAFSRMGSELGYFVGGCWYVIRRQDFEQFEPIAKANPFLYSCHIIHTPLFLLALKNSRKTIIMKEDYRARGASNVPRAVGFNLPSSNARIYYNLYFDVMRMTHGFGIISDVQWDYFRKNFFWYLLINMFKLRTRMYPQLYLEERGKIRENLAPFRASCSGAKLAFFRLYEWLLFATPLPFHWVYRAFYFYKTKVRGEKRDDYHQFYQERLANSRDANWLKNKFD